MNVAPIALFVYDRLDHTIRTVEALLKNHSVEQHDLIIYSDGGNKIASKSAVEAVRQYLKTIQGFHSVKIIYRSCNYGLAKSIITGVTEVLSKYDRIIVLEDDMVTSPYFLEYMNHALEKFSNENRVACVHGYVYPSRNPLPEIFFLRGADCWGWGTWRRGWALFNPNGQELLNSLMERNLTHEFDFDGSYGFTTMLKEQIRGNNNSWAIRWYASAFLADKMTLYPGRSLVSNIGNDSSGTHSDTSAQFNVVLSDSPIFLADVQVVESEVGRSAFIEFFNRMNSGRDYIFGFALKWNFIFVVKNILKKCIPSGVYKKIKNLFLLTNKATPKN